MSEVIGDSLERSERSERSDRSDRLNSNKVYQLFGGANGFIQRRLDQWQAEYKKHVDYNRKQEILAICQLELEGGHCYMCNKVWCMVKYFDFTYYLPDCKCFRICQNCGENLYHIQILGMLKSDDCFCDRCNAAQKDNDGNFYTKESWLEYKEVVSREKKVKREYRSY